MYKRLLLVGALSCSIFMSGCVTINTGGEEQQTSTQQEVQKPKESTPDTSNNQVVLPDASDIPNTSTAYSVYGYIFYDSDVRYLTTSDVANLTRWECKLAKNEIYARRGRLFVTDSIQDYFNSCSWYYGYISPDSFDDNSLNNVETANVNFLKQYE